MSPLAHASIRPAPLELRAGDCVDRYELLRPIARGGMGYVWAARLRGTRGFERIVAIKTALPELACDSRVRAMFLDEARVASAIVHRNVAPVLDFLEQGGAQYLVMEWVEGPSLQTLHDLCGSRGDRIPLGVLLRVLADACAGLHAAHELRDASGALCGLVHRDISPQNILISVEGVAKLIDFGVAKARSRATRETTFGALKGKLTFMSPEQARGEAVDRRADVWSVGATLFYLLTGNGPFEAEDRSETLRLLVTGSRPRPAPCTLHPAIGRILGACLARRPQDRFATAEQLGMAIEDAIEEIGVAATAKDVADCVADRAGAMIARQREHVRAFVREPQDSLPTHSGVVAHDRRPGERLRRLALPVAVLLGTAAALVFLARRAAPLSDAQGAVDLAPLAPAIEARPAPTARPDVSPQLELPPTTSVRSASARHHRLPPPPPRVQLKPHPPRPAVHASPPRPTDDFGSAVETRK